MASTTTTSITHPDGTIVNITTTSAAPAATADGSVKIYGMAISGNVIPCVLQALDTGVGNLSNIDFMAGEHKTEKMLAVNPFHQMPSMQDGDFCLAESNAIQRYMAVKYAPELYGAGNIEQQATIDWALDWCSTNLYKQYMGIWYPVAGFGKPPEDQAATNSACVENLGKFNEKFLKDSKFVCGDTLSIADYKVASWLWYMAVPAIKATNGFELPTRSAKYVEDFLAAIGPEATQFLAAPEGFMASKMPQ